jgi:hypothetical protein
VSIICRFRISPSPPVVLFPIAILAAFLVLGLGSPVSAQFVDRTAEAGLEWEDPTWSAAFSDLDLDGDLDLYVGHHFYTPVLYWNDGNGVFDDGLHPAPWSGMADRHGVLLLTLDGDFDPEMFIAHGSAGGGNPEANELYRNDGDGFLISLLGAGGMADVMGRGRAASAADFDRDGLVDIWIGKAPHATALNSLYRNNGSLFFVDVAASAGLDENLGTVGGLWGDVDNDGDADLFVGGEEFIRPSTLYRNDGGLFTDISSVFSPELPVVSGADFGDMDNDGDLDLAVCDGEIGIFDTFSEGEVLTFFFNSRYGDTGIDGLTVPSHLATATAVFQVEGSYDPSLLFLGPDEVNGPPDPPVLLTNEYVGEPDFTPGVDEGIWVWRVAPGGPWEIRCSTPDFGTYDGWLTDETFISGTIPYELEDPGFTPGGPRVWRNDGSVFSEITSALGLPGMLNPRDISWVDYDNDGDLDLHVVDMGTSAAPNAPDLLLRNDGSTFADVTADEVLVGSTLGMGDGGVWGDVDGDGDLDLFLQEGAGPRAFSALARGTLFLNEGERGNSIQLQLEGEKPAVAAIGACVTAVVGGQKIHRRVFANSWRGFQDPLRIHIGLADASIADTLFVDWPMGGTDVFVNVPPIIARLIEKGGITAAPLHETAPTAQIGWRLAGVQPQPASGAQAVLLVAQEDRLMKVSVYDAGGRLVQTLHRGRIESGETRLLWDGRDHRGEPVAAGVYFVRATDGQSVQAVRVVRLR